MTEAAYTLREDIEKSEKVLLYRPGRNVDYGNVRDDVLESLARLATATELLEELEKAAEAVWDDYLVHHDDCFVHHARREGYPKDPKCECGADLASSDLYHAINRAQQFLKIEASNA